MGSAQALLEFTIASGEEDRWLVLAEAVRVQMQLLDSEPEGLRVLLLDGPMGSGKTTFTRAFAKVMGSIDQAASPTYALESEYRLGNCRLYHWDLYRLMDWDDLESSGFVDRVAELSELETATGTGLGHRSILAVEWAKRLIDAGFEWPKGVVVLTLTIDVSVVSPEVRQIKLQRPVLL